MPTSQFLDILCQFVIALGGLTAIILVERNNRWGFMIGLLQQPFWFYTTIHNEQWGMFFLALVYAAVWTRGVYRRFISSAAEKGTA